MSDGQSLRWHLSQTYSILSWVCIDEVVDKHATTNQHERQYFYTKRREEINV